MRKTHTYRHIHTPLTISFLFRPGVAASPWVAISAKNQQPVINTPSQPPPWITTIWHHATKIDSKVTISEPRDQTTTHLIFIPYTLSPPPPPSSHVLIRTLSIARHLFPASASRGPLWLHLYVLTQEPWRGAFMRMGLQGWYQAPLMQSQEGQGALDEREASQRWGELTRIKSGCRFSKDAQTGNL